MKIWYPTVNKIKKINKFVINKYRATKAEKYELLIGGTSKLKEAIKDVKTLDSSIDDKSALLLTKIANVHAFGSANRRTAYFITNMFISKNKSYLLAKKREKQGEFMKKVRAHEVSHTEIKDWLTK